MIKSTLLKGFSIFLVFSLVACGSEPAEARPSGLPDFTGLVEDVSPAVVHISTAKKVERQMPWQQFVPPGGDMGPFEDLFKHFFNERGMTPPKNGQQPKKKQPKQAPPTYRTSSLGSGFIISDDGYVLTNHHVIDGADEIIVKLNDRRELAAKVIGSDERSDVAVLKVDAEDLPVVKVGNSEQLKVGEWVLAIGQPYGFESTVTAGIVSAKGRAFGGQQYVPLIQTDVAINQGNSGGPLFNMDGEVIGINSMIYSRSGGYMGLSFAIPMDLAMNVVKQLKDGGEVARGWLGVALQDLDHNSAKAVGLDRPAGAMVSEVFEDTPASKAGIQDGDVIVKYDGSEINELSELPPLVGITPVGSEVEIEVMRYGKRVTLTATIDALTDASGARGHGPGNSKLEEVGLIVGSASAEEAKASDLDEGAVIVREVMAGAGADAGLQVGDVILRANGEELADVDALEQVLENAEAGEGVLLQIMRGNRRRFVALMIPEDQ